MKKIVLLVLFCLTGMLSASVPEWKFTLGKNEIRITASVPANEYLYRKETDAGLTADGVAVKPVTFPSTLTHEDEFSGKTEIYPGGEVLTWVFHSDGWKFPLVVKPVSEGSTYGLSVVDSPADWEKALDLVFQYGSDALVEEFFTGVEVTLGIIAGKALPMIEIRYTTKVYDYDAKYLHKTCETQYLCHAPAVPEPIQEKLRAASLEFFRLSGAQDILRTDMIVNVQTGEFIMLEGNAIPGCTANSLVPKAAKAMGMSFPDMCALLLEGAAARYSL